MSVETNPHNYTNMNLIFSQFLPARISPKENSGANGKFLPKPLLFHLRLPNSKTNQPKFWQILSSPKNSFAKASSALKPATLPEYLEGRTPKKNVPCFSDLRATNFFRSEEHTSELQSQSNLVCPLPL